MGSKYNAIIGIHIGHDRCAAVIKEGIVAASIAEERLDRIKYSPGDLLPTESISCVLKIAQIKPNEISAVAVTFGGLVFTRSILRSWQLEVMAYFEIEESQIHFVGHHLAHAYAVYYTSAFDETAIMIADGAGDMLNEHQCEAESYYLAKDGNIELFFARTQSMPTKYGSPLTEYRGDYMFDSESKLPIGIGRKYEQLTKLIGFTFGQAGKTMGLSPYGTQLIAHLPETLGMKHTLTRGDYLKQLDEQQLASGQPYNMFIQQNKANIAKDIQTMTEQLLLSCIEELAQKTQTENLCLSGGVFLNCVANKKVLDSQYFKNVFITPASGDDGQAIGAAYFVHNKVFKGTVSKRRFNPYLGPEYTNKECMRAATKLKLEFKQFDETEILIDQLTDALIKDEVFGLLQGRSETGPRALGNRSIVASPFGQHMRDHINSNIKYREDFRPFAPMITEEAAATFFEIDCESPYMLLTCHVRPQYREMLPAITHVNGSARLQTIRQSDNPFLHRLLTVFGTKTQIPVLLNTSFNTAREPIVETPFDALRTLKESSLDGVILEHIWVSK